MKRRSAVIGFVLAPLAPSIIFAIGAIVLGLTSNVPLELPISGYFLALCLWFLHAVVVSYPATLIIGIPGYLKRIITKAAERLKFDKNLTSLFARISSITLIIFGFITAFGTLGINVSALVAGLGLTGFALGFALKDTISNLLSGVLILLYQPFRTGDRIKISG